MNNDDEVELESKREDVLMCYDFTWTMGLVSGI
jgi:hypothetical protein